MATIPLSRFFVKKFMKLFYSYKVFRIIAVLILLIASGLGTSSFLVLRNMYDQWYNSCTVLNFSSYQYIGLGFSFCHHSLIATTEVVLEHPSVALGVRPLTAISCVRSRIDQYTGPNALHINCSDCVNVLLLLSEEKIFQGHK